ncbi:DUF6115 domain-containing protein [Bacillus piscicola]|uniref:DUF6115 domain-containing protein n=1 Tax=Bacillus piscicola TaxID=1632684 RepID=UPI001F08E408|nr:hypothetical protein [Bacillus piscicola]
MMILFIVVSLSLHLLAFFFIIIIFQEQRSLKKERRDLQGLREEIEELLTQALDDINAENSELKEALEAAEAEREPRRWEEQEKVYDPVQLLSTTEKEEYHPPSPEKAVTVEKSLQAEVLSLASHGYENKEIAKKLKIGQTEVELLLKFYDK